jgi:type I restriction enzyme S subunit
VRFDGFTELWAECKLGKISEVVGGGTPDTTAPEYWGGEIDWYAPAEIGAQIYVGGSRRKITSLGLQKSSATILPVGTVLFTSRAGIGNTAILKKEGATNQGFQSIVPHKNELDSYFIFSRTHELKKYGETVGAGSTFVEVSGKQMAAMLLFVPTFVEQIAIGNFFRMFDEQITVQAQKLEQLKKLKATYLQKMYI